VAEPWVQDREYVKYTLWFVFACIIYSIIGFSWGAIVGAFPAIRDFVNHRPHGNLIMLAHGHINLLGWVEMAIFASIYYVIPRLVRRHIYSLKLVRIHFWTHNLGLIGMVVFFLAAGILGGMTSVDRSPEEVTAIVRPLMISVGMFGFIVLSANCIWAYNIFKTCAGWRNRA